MAEYIDVYYGEGYDYPVTVRDDSGQMKPLGRFFYNSKVGEWVLRIQHDDIEQL